MISQTPQGPRRQRPRPTRWRKLMARLVLLGALSGSLGLGILLCAPAPTSGGSVSALAEISPLAPMEGIGGPWVP
jgi:hypothetical protein